MSNLIAGAVVIDATVAIAITAKEIVREPMAASELLTYSTSGYLFYAPGTIVAETLYILCGKLQQGKLTSAEHSQAVLDFRTLMSRIAPPPSGEVALVERAEAIRSGFGCSRSADGIYISLAEELSKSMPVVILTFDQDMHKQAARNAPAVVVRTLII